MSDQEEIDVSAASRPDVRRSLAGLALAAAALGAATPAHAAVPAAVERYAPHVRIHPAETTLPTAARDLVAAAGVRWRGCRFTAGVRVAGAPAADGVHAREAALGRGRLAHRVGVGARCRYVGRSVASNLLSRPLQGGPLRARGVPLAQGFVLDLPARVRRGRAPVAGEVSAPMYFEYVPGRVVTYWFLSADSGVVVDAFDAVPPALAQVAPLLAGRRLRLHEGDWERVAVRLDATDRAIEIAYYQHGRPRVEPWAAAAGRLEDGEHPVVFSALASHASYPEAGAHRFALATGGGTLAGTYDATADGGLRWRGERLLRDARAEGWYGFGGAWGAPAPLGESTDPRLRAARDIGPLGPGPRRGVAPCGWGATDRAGRVAPCDVPLGAGELPGL